MKKFLTPEQIAETTLDWCHAYYTCLGLPWMSTCSCYRLYGSLCGEENKFGCEEPSEDEKREIMKGHFVRYVRAWKVYGVGGLGIALRRVAGEHALPCDIRNVFVKAFRSAISLRGRKVVYVDVVDEGDYATVRARGHDGSTLYEARVYFECLDDGRVRIRVVEASA